MFNDQPDVCQLVLRLCRPYYQDLHHKLDAELANDIDETFNARRVPIRRVSSSSNSLDSNDDTDKDE